MSYPTKKPSGRKPQARPAGWSQPRVVQELHTEARWPAVSIPANSLKDLLPEVFARTGGGSPRSDIQAMVAKHGSIKAGIQGMIDAHPVFVIATSTCPFCVEAKRTLAGHGISGEVLYVDKEPNTAAIRKAMTSIVNRTSVPQIWINQKHVGGCDDLKALDVTGDLGMLLQSVPRAANVSDAESGSSMEETSTNSAITTHPGPNAAYFGMFHAPISADNRVVRLGGCVTTVFAAACVVFAERYATIWVVFGMLVSMFLDMAGIPNPYSLLIKLPFAGTKPRLQSGPARQFANFCGVIFAGTAWVCMISGKPLGGQVMMAILCGAAFFQGFFNFCAGCWVFGYMLKFKLVSSAIYRLHVNTRADTLYTWDKSNVRTGKGGALEPITYPTKGLPSNPTDLRAKAYDADDKWQRFHPIKYCHVDLFVAPLSILGLALPWARLHETIGTTPLVWQILASIGVTVEVIIGSLFIAKCILYPNKVRKEWNHPIKHNLFAPPFIGITVMSILATKLSGEYTEDLARVLFWIGSAPLNAMGLYTVAGWIAKSRDREFINPTWMLLPVGNLVGAVASRQVDQDYVEWGWYMFSVGCLLWLALWPITFFSSIDNFHSESRYRYFYGIWIAPPSAATIAYSTLTGATAINDVQRFLFYASLAMAVVMALCMWPLDFFLEAPFAMSAFAFSFPLDVLAVASVLMYSYTPTDLMQVICFTCVAVACLVNTANLLQLLGALTAGRVMTPQKKNSPVSFIKLTHEAFREALPMLEKLAAQVQAGQASAPKLRELASAWKAVSTAHDIHSRHEDAVIFPTLETYFPGQTHSVGEDHKEHEKLLHAVQHGIDSLLGAKGATGDRATGEAILSKLQADIRKYGKEIREHMDNEEHFYSTPIIRKYLNLAIAKDLARRSWEVTPNAQMSEFLRWVLSSLRVRAQRTQFLKSWTWAMPERAELVGLMVYRVVDDVTWVQIARDMPEIVPRGLPGHRRYF